MAPNTRSNLPSRVSKPFGFRRFQSTTRAPSCSATSLASVAYISRRVFPATPSRKGQRFSRSNTISATSALDSALIGDARRDRAAHVEEEAPLVCYRVSGQRGLTMTLIDGMIHQVRRDSPSSCASQVSMLSNGTAGSVHIHQVTDERVARSTVEVRCSVFSASEGPMTRISSSCPPIVTTCPSRTGDRPGEGGGERGLIGEPLAVTHPIRPRCSPFGPLGWSAAFRRWRTRPRWGRRPSWSRKRAIVVGVRVNDEDGDHGFGARSRGRGERPARLRAGCVGHQSERCHPAYRTSGC